jgi:hypothetical protein
MQDHVAMTRMISLITSMMEQELHIRKNLYAEKKATYNAMSLNYFRRHKRTTKGGRGKDGK